MMMEDYHPNTNGIHLSGVTGIRNTYLQQDKRTGECRIETDGSNLAGVFGIPEVDHTRTICNDPMEVRLVLGVEAARATLIRELEAVLSFDSNYVNKRHAILLADIMTHGGELMSITRHGLNRRVKYGPLSKCSFEETAEVLHDAGRFHQKDNLKGVTEAIIMGTHAPVGTHTFSLFLDTNRLAESGVDNPKELLSKPVGEPKPEFVQPAFSFTAPPCLQTSFAPSSPSHSTAFVPSSPSHSTTFAPSSPTPYDNLKASCQPMDFSSIDEYGHYDAGVMGAFVPSSPSHM
jgi:DNA-directed RNA polymerase II subunit RPB1